jgi:hypothetical protein
VARALGPKEGGDQAEGCLDTFTSPMPFTKTEISLDIGSPSFLFVADQSKVSDPSPITRSTIVGDRRNARDHKNRMIAAITGA